ncbi:MAG: hypothetical protein HYT80_00215 [Euryarchaeota archaeon]|nr:hypothetical protein [Euryarchaeota archaeon]
MAPVPAMPTAAPIPGTNRNSILALAFGVAGAIPAVIGIVGDELVGVRAGNLAMVLLLAGLACSITAIVFGALGIRQANRYVNAGPSMAMAVTGLVLGILGSLFGVFAFLVVLLFFALCAACASAASIPAAAASFANPFTSLGAWMRATWRNLLRAPGRVLLAHHPACAAFDRDVARFGPATVCAGCIGVVAGAAAGVALLPLLAHTIPAGGWLLVGVALAVVGAATTLLRVNLGVSGRVVARMPVGLGLVAFAEGLLRLPPEAAVSAFVAAAFASGLLGALRISTMRARIAAAA